MHVAREWTEDSRGGGKVRLFAGRRTVVSADGYFSPDNNGENAGQIAEWLEITARRVILSAITGNELPAADCVSFPFD